MKNLKVIAMALIACFAMASCSSNPAKMYEKATKNYEKKMEKLDKTYEKALKAEKKDALKAANLKAEYRYEVAVLENETQAVILEAEAKFFGVEFDKADYMATMKAIWEVQRNSETKATEWEDATASIDANHKTWEEKHDDKLQELNKKYADEKE